MKNEVVQLLAAALLLFICAGLEELLPKFCGVGIPLLLAAVAGVSLRREATFSFFFAVAAGGLEDALSALAPLTSVSYFLVVWAMVRWLRVSWPLMAALYPGYQLWLFIWTSGIGGGVFTRLLTAIPVGLLTAWCLGGLLRYAERGSAVDEQG